MSNSKLQIIRLPHGQDLELPSYASKSAAGMDLRAACDDNAPIVIKTSQRMLVPTGMIFEIPVGYEGQIRPRSGLAYHNGITCLNTPGTIDSDYRGEVMVLLINHGSEPFTIRRGMRIAQLVIASVCRLEIIEGDLATPTDRGSGGFGSTGVD
jgi:dUTP pyrophosphatase